MKMINRYYIGQHVYIGANFYCQGIITAIQEEPAVNYEMLKYTFKFRLKGHEVEDKVMESHIFDSEQDFFDKMEKRSRIPEEEEEVKYIYWTGTADRRQSNDQE